MRRVPDSKLPIRLSLPLYVGAVSGVVFLGIVVYTNSAVGRLDLAAVHLLQRLRSDELTALAVGITEVGATKSIILVTLVTAGFLLIRGHWHGAVSIAVSVAATQGIVYAIKSVVARGRPPASSAFVEAAGYAFPSAHAASGVALYGLLALFVLRRVHGRTRIAACLLALAGVGSIGLTRIYLGAHYPTDVLAGWLVGALAAAGAWSVGQALRARQPGPALAS